MPSTEFLGRIRQLFKSVSDARFDDIRRGLRTGRLIAPAQPMSDQELSRAIREFQAARDYGLDAAETGKRPGRRRQINRAAAE